MFLGSPVKANALPVGCSHPKSQTSIDNSDTNKLQFDPRPAHAQHMPKYSDYVRNITINYKSFYTDSLPLSQLFAPANRHGIEWGHDYLEQLLSHKLVTTITREEAERIQMETLGQYNNKNWFRERRVRLHASNFGRICKVKDEQKLCADLLLYKNVNAAALEHGRKFESVAVHEF